jgi:hypothetical protein
MNFRRVALGCLVSAGMAAFGSTAPANATTYTYAGSWQVDQGPDWFTSFPTGPLAYTGQEAAALLFGGTASHYVVSTVDNDPAHINFSAWYSIIGYAGGHILADDYNDKYLGLYYGPPIGYPKDDPKAPASAYIDDNATGSEFRNFAFIASGVPEPASWAMLLIGFGGIGFALRRQRASTTLA